MRGGFLGQTCKKNALQTLQPLQSAEMRGCFSYRSRVFLTEPTFLTQGGCPLDFLTMALPN